MSNPGTQVGSLDLAARAIDLTTALLKATTSSGSLLKGAWEIGQWLGREKLNQYELLDCMEKAKDLVFANKHGQQFFDKVIRGLDTMSVGPLFLQQSGSLGRLMAGDPHLSWVVSTVACLFQHHRDDRIVTEMLTALIMESRRPDPHHGNFSPLDSAIYSPEHTRLRAVVRKIVSSVWYNVVNVGCDTIPLPQELLELCPRGHYLEPGDFGIVTNIIYAHCPSKAILRTDHLLRDVLLWLLLHYDGTVIVNAGGRIVYNATLGNPDRELEVRVASLCPGDGNCGLVERESYEILRHISGNFEELLSGFSFSQFTDLPPQPGIRQKLYDIPRPYPGDSPMWNKGLQILVKSSAQFMMRWLLHVPLSAQDGFSAPGFSAEPGREAAPDDVTVSLILKKFPAMISLQWGNTPASQIAFENRSQAASDSGPAHGTSAWDSERSLSMVLEYFPVLADLMTKVSKECLCMDCCGRINDRGSNMKTGRLRLGCLKRTALEETFLLLAHGIADGFGVSDASAVLSVDPIVEGITTLLLELASESKVCWSTWFATVSCVYLGCPFQTSVSPEHSDFGGTAFVAIQYGNLAAQAPWLDLTKELSVRGCFGLVGSKGRLGVITRRDDRSSQFRSVEENFAIIETENTEDVAAFLSKHKKEASFVDHSLNLIEDKERVESDVILCQMDDKFYRLLLRIKTRTHWRIVDPSDAFSAAIRMMPSATCQHNNQLPALPPFAAKIYTMDEILGRWPDTVRSMNPSKNSDEVPQAGIIHISHILDTHLKKNVALSLSVCSTAVPIYPELICTTCAIRFARKAVRKPLRDEGEEPANRYIINMATCLAVPETVVGYYLTDGSNKPGGERIASSS
ncbi:hypothetical protein B0I35DRAFT_118041 [Stachybotrys elegans]|uniref:Uncharacterized protein n=1 Tax=Stachybotrys elegans TaxID=80388 RepID=A0A8K0T0M3_9HYPO|nr:hypothetical protein B0I35DRAFT_118041 [Stachybotrys elegans]